MLNLQFAETMELTEAELEKVYGGDLCVSWQYPKRCMGRVRDTLVNH